MGIVDQKRMDDNEWFRSAAEGEAERRLADTIRQAAIDRGEDVPVVEDEYADDEAEIAFLEQDND